MTRCVGTGPQTELEFVASVSGREPGDVLVCRGPLVALTMDFDRLAALTSGIHRPSIHALVRPQRHPSGIARVVLCALHWLDVAYEVGHSGLAHRRGDWVMISESVVRSMCAALSWDAKEIANMFRWQRLAA